MEAFGMTMQGTFIIERVNGKPDWASSDSGRIIYETISGTYHIGGQQITDGVDGWIPIGLTNTNVKDFHIDWDTAMTGEAGKVSAYDLPCRYDSVNTNVQDTITSMEDDIRGLKSGLSLGIAAVKDYHIDWTSGHRISAAVIPIENANGFFSGASPKIEEALNELAAKNASDIMLDPSGTFGSDLGITATNVQEGLEGIEGYVKALSADDLPCTYLGCSGPSNVQFVLDALYTIYGNLEFKNLINVPHDYGNAGQILKTDGVNGLVYADLISNDVQCQYPGSTPTNVQAALWVIQQTLATIQTSIASPNVNAEDVAYTSSPIVGLTFADVDNALNYLFMNAYTPANKPTSTEIASSGIGTAETVQQALTYLLNQINHLMTLIPTTIDSLDVYYDSMVGTTSVREALDYLFGSSGGTGGTGGV